MYRALTLADRLRQLSPKLARGRAVACWAKGLVGYALKELGAWDRAEQALRDAIRTAEANESEFDGWSAKLNLAVVTFRIGDRVGGIDLARRALAFYSARQIGAPLTDSRLYLARLLAEDNALDEAEALAREAIDSSSGVRHTLALTTHAYVLERMGRVDEARECCERAFEAKAKEGLVEAEGLLQTTWARILDSMSEREAAGDALAEARSELVLRAERVLDPELRRAFLHAIPEHAEIMGR
jgi:tetratricopeptide (TPR) repeat protein